MNRRERTGKIGCDDPKIVELAQSLAEFWLGCEMQDMPITPIETRARRNPLPANPVSPVRQTNGADGLGDGAVGKETATAGLAHVAAIPVAAHGEPHDRSHGPVHTMRPSVCTGRDPGSNVTQ